ncbi:MAG: class III signal peptide-containing protein [Candidatus Omnitrophica bacterium]|nr:class III signal peptide-containing protein [Candidatus Omnitrophota bacterium]
MLGNRRAQTALEYALLIAVVVIALLAINVYMTRGVRGRLKESTDQIGRQFDPTTFSTSWQAASSGETTSTETRTGTGSTTTDITASEIVTRGEHDTFGNNVPGEYY